MTPVPSVASSRFGFFGSTVTPPTFVDAGFDLLDTADVYSRWAPGNHGGESESIIGRWLKRSGRRDRVVVATKVGLEMGPADKGLSRDYIFRAVERSLNRLQVDRID